MANTITPEQQQAILQQLNEQNPEFAASPPALQQAYIDAVTVGTPAERARKMEALHQQYPQYIKNESIWKNKAFLIGLAALGGGVAYAALAGGTAAGAGGAAASGGGAAGAGTAATTAAAGAGGGSLLHALLPSIIGAGASLGGTAIASHANTEAAKIAAEQADKALAIQQQQYALQRQDTAPYRALGQGAVGNLGYLSGIDLPQSKIDELSSTVPNTAPPPLPNASTPPPSSTLASLGQPQASTNAGLVPVKNPATGLIHLIPADQVGAAQQRGGVLVNA